MSRYIHKAKKIRLAKKARQTRWAPHWAVRKITGRAKHPSFATKVKRSWRKTKINK